jgi:hypothetical protein
MLGDEVRTIANGGVTTGEVNRALAHILERARFADMAKHAPSEHAAFAGTLYFEEFPHPEPLELEVLNLLAEYILGTTEVDVVIGGHRWHRVIEGHTTDPDGRVIRLDLGIDK